MPRRDALLPSFAFSGKRESQKSKSLSEDCLRRLKHVVKLAHQIDLAAARELHACKQIEALSRDHRKDKPQKLLTSEEMQQFEAFHLKVTNHRSTIAAIQTEGEISTYLSDTECTSDWLLASTVTSRIQNRYVVLDGSIAVWDECRTRAQVFLDLGVSTIQYLRPIKLELQEHADEILFAMRMKLNVIKVFDPIFRHKSQIPPHPFVNLLVYFNFEDSSPTNVAESYPAIDNSLRAILSATTLLVVVSCMIPIVLAWQRSSTEVGSKNDPDFWAALQTMLMQLLNLFTMMLPVSRFAPAVAWRLAWTFAIIAGVCNIATPVLYTTLPVKWSFLASYMASAAQATVLLEVMLNSKYSRGKTA